jgi:alpha-beta hydrolase superfamily lysophospholipase
LKKNKKLIEQNIKRIQMIEDKLIGKSYNNYFPDVLGDGFNKLTFSLKDDYEGKVIATLVRRDSKTKTKKAILYIHGFNDYFFQEEMAKTFNKQGYNFYALDLRKYGRSYLKHQKLNNVRSLQEYDEEIDISLKTINSENNSQVILMGHSTGAYTVALLTNDRSYLQSRNMKLKVADLISIAGRYDLI